MWDLSEIVDADPERGARLLQATSASNLRGLVLGALRRTLILGTTRLGAGRNRHRCPLELMALALT